MVNEQKLCKIALLSAAMILILTSVTGAVPLAYITNYGDNSVSIIDTTTNIVTATVTVGGSPDAVAISPDGTMVYILNGDKNTISVINTKTNSIATTISGLGSHPTGLAITPDGKKLYVSNYFSYSVSVIDTNVNDGNKYNTVIATVNGIINPYGVAVSHDGTKVYVAEQTNNPGKIAIIDTAYDTLDQSSPISTGIGTGNSPTGLAVTPDGTKLYVTNFGDGTVSVVDTATNTVTATVTVRNTPQGIAVTPDGSKVYVANEGGTVSVIDTNLNDGNKYNTVIATVNVGNSPYGVAVTPDGTKVYVANQGSNTVSVIDTASDTLDLARPTITVGTNPDSFGQFIGNIPIVKIQSSPALQMTLEDYAATIGLMVDGAGTNTPVAGGSAAVDMSYGTIATWNTYDVAGDLVISNVLASSSGAGAADFNVCPWLEVGSSSLGSSPDSPGTGGTVYVLDGTGKFVAYHGPNAYTFIPANTLPPTWQTSGNIITPGQDAFIHVLVQPVSPAVPGESLTVTGSVASQRSLP